MQIVKIKGGLGNQLFQYFFGQYLKSKFGHSVFYDTTWFSDKKLGDIPRNFILPYLFSDIDKFIDNSVGFNILKNIKRKEKFIIRLMNWGFSERYSHAAGNLFYDTFYFFDSDFRNIDKNVRRPSCSRIFDGYWQDKRFFESLKLKINFSDQLSKISLSNFRFKVILRDICATNSVALHIRRSDYLDKKNELLFFPLDELYYNQALKVLSYYKLNLKYFIFSDDISWAKQNIKIPDSVYVEGFNEIEDFLLMNQCNYQIIANSTFSWWAAMLSNKSEEKTVFMPSKWFYNDELKDRKLQVDSWVLVPIN